MQPRHGSEALDRLLDEDAYDDAPLSRVLAAARGPARPDELAGLAAARAAFVSSTMPGARPATARPARSRTLAGRLLAVKAIAAVSGASLLGGAAYAVSDNGLLGGSSHARPLSSAHQAVPGQASAAVPYRPAGTPAASRPGAPARPSPARHAPGRTAAATHPPRPPHSAPAAPPRHTPSQLPSPSQRSHHRGADQEGRRPAQPHNRPTTTDG